MIERLSSLTASPDSNRRNAMRLSIHRTMLPRGDLTGIWPVIRLETPTPLGVIAGYAPRSLLRRGNSGYESDCRAKVTIGTSGNVG